VRLGERFVEIGNLVRGNANPAWLRKALALTVDRGLFRGDKDSSFDSAIHFEEADEFETSLADRTPLIRRPWRWLPSPVRRLLPYFGENAERKRVAARARTLLPEEEGEVLITHLGRAVLYKRLP